MKKRHRIGVVALVLVVSAAVGVLGQANSGAGVVHGSVRDAQGNPVAGATVELHREGSAEKLKTRTDDAGGFRFPVSFEGTCTLRVEAGGRGAVQSEPFRLSASQEKRVDLRLAPLAASGGRNSKPEFYDEPQFTVAGVTDTTNLGGHGSNATSRTKAELTKEVIALGSDPAGSSVQGSADLQAREKALRDRIAREPDNCDANLQLGTLLAESGRASEAAPFLRGALAQMGGKDAAERAAAYFLLAGVEEKLGDPLEAVRHYKHAAELDPSEAHLFEWGAELLKHNAAEPATEVLAKGSRLHPQSARMLIALGVAWYARGAYDKAAQYVAAASDLDVDAEAPYMFLGKLQSVDTTAGLLYVEKLGRFAERDPANAWANYYYALSLWKGRTGPDDARLGHVEALLDKAVALDGKLGPAYVLLGTVRTERGQVLEAVAALETAARVSPQLAEAHYRLAQAYKKVGEMGKAEEELKIYSQLSKAAAEDEERERREMRQFVYTLGRSQK